jgi:hypothetical protein
MQSSLRQYQTGFGFFDWEHDPLLNKDIGSSENEISVIGKYDNVAYRQKY